MLCNCWIIWSDPPPTTTGGLLIAGSTFPGVAGKLLAADCAAGDAGGASGGAPAAGVTAATGAEASGSGASGEFNGWALRFGPRANWVPALLASALLLRTVSTTLRIPSVSLSDA